MHDRICIPCQEKKKHVFKKTISKGIKTYMDRGLCKETALILANPYINPIPPGIGRESKGIIKIMMQENGRYHT